MEIKREYPDALLFYHMGDFYELFYDDAKKAARLLGITLTTRGQTQGASIPMAGVPLHSVESYIIRLVKLGESIAICDQVGDPKASKGPVAREVKRVITPGTLLEENFLPGSRDNWLMGICTYGKDDERRIGVAEVELSTAQFVIREFKEIKDVISEIVRIHPAEILVNEDDKLPLRSETADSDACVVRDYPAWNFEYDTCQRLLCEHFGVMNLQGFGCADMPAAIVAAGALLQYIHSLKNDNLQHLRSLKIENDLTHLRIDATSRMCLEIDANRPDSDTSQKESSLIGLFDRACTPMGTRCIRRWFAQPLRDHAQIKERQDVVASWLEESQLTALRDHLSQACDLERVVSRVATGHARPRDLVGILRTLETMPDLIALCGPGYYLPEHRLSPCLDLADLLKRALDDEPAQTLKDGGVIRAGYDADLDQWRNLRSDVARHLADIEQRERQRSGIDSLKVAYNRIHGYYIEMPRSQAERAPENYRRLQTLKNVERYTIPELRELENRILSADERARARERQLYDELLERVMPHFDDLQSNARALSEIDALATFALCARTYNYNRPQLTDEPTLSIEKGRHPVVEHLNATPFVPNDLEIDDANRVFIITGPNMGGKSTYMRQVAHIALLAHIGSWVPAEKATIGAIDAIYTRIGAGDNIASGQSTFMVEMTEAAEILHNATEHSLVLMDEIGRGTSTYDGMSLAWACAARLATINRSLTLFATHYLELTELADLLPKICNVHLDAIEKDDKVIFRHRVKPGMTDRSYGLHVAKLAGIPHDVIAAAGVKMEEIKKNVAAELNGDKNQTTLPGIGKAPAPAPTNNETPPTPETNKSSANEQATLDKIKQCNPDTLSPREALSILFELAETLANGNKRTPPR